MATITFHGNPLQIGGELPALGEAAPAFSLTGCKLEEVGLAAFSGKKKLLLVVPSVDTPVCAASARIFSHRAGRRRDTVVLLVSADLPFAQDRFCTNERLNNLIPLSTMRSGFAADYGVNIVDGILRGLTARAVFVIDERDRIVYRELVGEVTDEPDYQSALAALFLTSEPIPL
jgi:thiol peroxidase